MLNILKLISVAITQLLNTIKKQSHYFLYSVPEALESTLSYILRLLKIFTTFTVELYNSFKPLFLVFKPVVSYLFSYKTLFKAFFYFGVFSKVILLFSPIVTFLPVHPALLPFMVDYLSFITSIIVFVKSSFNDVKGFVLEFQGDKNRIRELETSVVTLENSLSLANETYTKKECGLESQIRSLTADIEIQRDRTSRLLALNDQLQRELSQSQNVAFSSKAGRGFSSFNSFTFSENFAVPLRDIKL